MNPRKISRETRVLIVLFLLGIAFKGFLLWQRSSYIDPDEGYYLLLARNLVSGNGYTLNGLSNIMFPPLLPLLIAFFYYIFHNLQLSLGIISAVSGGLLGLVAFKICRSRFSLRYSVFGSFLVLFIYQLNVFVPIAKPYVYILYRGSDIFNCLLVLSSLLMTIRLVQTNKILYSIGAGFFFSMAYLTRPEGFLFWLVVVVLLIFLSAVRMARISFKRILIFMLTFIICSLPYTFYLKNVTGHWMLSGKIAAGQEYRDALIKVIKNGDWESFNGVHYSMDSNLLEMNDNYFGYHTPARRSGSGIMPFLKNIGDNLSLSAVLPKVLFPYPLLFFFVIGITAGSIQILKNRSAFDVILFSVFFYSLALVAVSYPMPRHHLFLVPVFCIYSLLGIRLVLSLFMKKLKRTVSLTIVLSAIFLSFASDYIRYFDASFITSRTYKMVRQVDRTISEYLRSRGTHVIMSMQPEFAVRASSDWQVLPRTDFYTLLKFAVKKRVDHIILKENTGYFFRIIEMNGSFIPDSATDKIGYQIIDSQNNFALVRLIKPASADGSKMN
jgi:4-amino-4-deoxy-L-arabinose transferase-like glycosyltransferase